MIIEKRQKDKDKVFRFLKKYITLSMVSILLFISFMFFTVYRNLEISRVTWSSIGSLLQLGSSCESLFDFIIKVSFKLYNDGDILCMVNDSNMDTLDIVHANSRFRSFTSIDPSIISIYVYSRKTDCFYTTLPSGPEQSRINFFDKEAVNYINNIQSIKALHPIPRKIKPYGMPDVPNNTINVYTFVYYGLPKYTTGNFSRAILINVSEESVRKSIDLWSKGIEGSVCIINEEGLLVSSLYRDELLQDISKDEFVEKILKYKKEIGYFVCNVSGIKSFVTYAYSNNLGWYFIRIIPYSSIYDNLKKVGSITVGSIFLYTAIGFMLSYIITGKAKKTIDDIIDGLKMQIKDNRSELEKLKEGFLYSILKNGISSSPSIVSKNIKKYNITLSTEDILILIMFRIDHYHKLCTKLKSYDIAILRKAIIKTASEVFSKYLFETVDMENDHIILAFNDTKCPDVDQIDSMIKLVQDSVEKSMKISLSAILSPLEYTFNDISLLYTETKQASNYRLFYGHRCIIHSEKLKILDTEGYIYPVEKEKMLLDTLMLGNVEPARKLLDEIIYSTKDYPHTVLTSLLLKLTFTIWNAFEKLEHIGKYSLDYDFNSFAATLNMCETIDEIRGRFYHMFNRVFSILEERKKSKYELLINKAIAIINKEYADEGLCLNIMAIKLGMSPGYLGKLFKTYTSKSVADYINQVRMENSLKLLKTSRMQINDISTAVGFSSKNYFYTVFKRTFGITPYEYRRNTIIKIEQ